MINELYQLSEAMEKARIPYGRWHKDYRSLPGVSAKKPCVRVLVDGGHIVGISSVSAEQARVLRRFGSNQGYFPGMNLAALYFLDKHDKEGAALLACIAKGEYEKQDIESLKALCSNNWKKVSGKYGNCMKVRRSLQKKCKDYGPMQTLIRETEAFTDMEYLFSEFERIAFSMLEERRNTALALHVLFYAGDPKKAAGDPKKAEDKDNVLSVIFDCEALERAETPVISSDFTKEVNRALLASEEKTIEKETDVDAFGFPYTPTKPVPMPTVTLPAGYKAALRTMFKGQLCQKRYGKIEDETFPICKTLRCNLSGALGWLSAEELKNKTWMKVDKDEILFVYPYELPQQCGNYVRIFRRTSNEKARFIEAARQMLDELRRGKDAEADPCANGIRIFFLRKISKAQTKAIYSRSTTALELEHACEDWDQGAHDLPRFRFGCPEAPFLSSVADVLRKKWNRKGEVGGTKGRRVAYYRGFDTLFSTDRQLFEADLRVLVQELPGLAAYIRPEFDRDDPNYHTIMDLLAMLGIYLHKLGIRKEHYMEEFAFLLGQLLQVSDDLHLLYGNIVRGSIPGQLVGSGLYIAASESPTRTLVQLGQRMNPYLTWAKSYAAKKEEHSKLAGWYLAAYRGIMTKLTGAFNAATRFNDAEKAQLFIGYLAELPNKKKIEKEQDQEKEDTDNAE